MTPRRTPSAPAGGTPKKRRPAPRRAEGLRQSGPEAAHPSGPRIRDLVEVVPVATVVRLDGTRGRLGELVITADVRRALSEVLGASSGETGAGLFVVGPFGSGKSHLLAAIGELAAPDRGLPAGFDAQLAALAAVARPSLVVEVPLVEHRREAALEDVVLERGFLALGRAVRGAGADRTRAFDALLGEARAQGHAGLVVLIDELSEFLRAKRGPDLTEDLRFLQFLGEWASARPVVVVGALQESLEVVANVSERELARIRDRYRPSLTLSMRHVEDLVRGRLVRVRPGAEQAIDRIYEDLAASFPGFGATRERFLRCYPLHPATLEVLEGLRMVLSERRGVVDFICRELLGDEASGTPPWQERPCAELLTPDRIYDHFRTRLEERGETQRLAHAVVPYFEREVPAIFAEPSDRELALRAVKLLTLLAASPLERPRSAAELAGMLLSRMSVLDAAANVAYLEEEVLAPLVRRGAYVVARPGEPPTYAVEVEADAAIVAGRLVAQARAETGVSDRRVARHLLALGSSPGLPLGLLAEVGLSRRELVWQNTLRSLLVGLGRLPELEEGEADDLVGKAKELRAEGCVVVGEVELDPAFDPGAEARRLSARRGLAIWAPASPSEEEANLALELYARAAVLDKARRESPRGGGLVGLLEAGAEADAAQARELLRKLYYGGGLYVEGERAPVDLASVAGLGFDRQLAALGGALLEVLHPRHVEVAPRSELVGERIVREILGEVFSERPGPARRSERVRALVHGYLLPLGLARRRGEGFVVGPDPVASPAVAEALRLVPDKASVETAAVVAALGEGPLGLTEAESLLVLNACVNAGLLEAFRGNRRLLEPFVAVSSADRLRTGTLLEPSLREALAAVSPIVGEGPFEPWNASVQQAAYERAKRFVEARRADLAEVRAALERCAEDPLVSLAPSERLKEDLDRLAALFEAVEGEGTPAGYLTRLIGAIDDAEALLGSARRVEALARFAREDLARVERALRYLSHPELELPEDEVRLRAMRDELLALAGEVLDLAAEERAGEFLRLEREFKDAYVATYREAHDRHYRAVGPAELDSVRRSPAYVALAALSGIGASAVPDDRVKLDRALAQAAPAPCTRPLELELAYRPRCACGFVLGTPAPSLEVDRLVELAERGAREHLVELAAHEHRRRLELAASDLERLGEQELAKDLARLLRLLDDPAGADLSVVARLVSPRLAELCGRVLSGSEVVARRDLAALREDLIGRRYPKKRLLELLARWVDPEGALPAGALVEVVDTADTAGRGEGPSDKEASGYRAGGSERSATAAALAKRFPALAACLPDTGASEAFWLAAWWAGRPGAPASVPGALSSDPDRLARAAEALLSDPGAREELAALDARVGPGSLIGEKVEAALDVHRKTPSELAALAAGEHLLRYPLRLVLEELLGRIGADPGLAARLPIPDPAHLARAHALVEEPELVPLGPLLEAAAHLGVVERRLGDASARELVEDLYARELAPVAALLARAEVAASGSTLVSSEAVRALRVALRRVGAEADRALERWRGRGLPGCLALHEVGAVVVAPLLAAHGRVAVLLVDAMRADLWRRLRVTLSGALPDRRLEETWAVVAEPTRTAEALAALALGRPVGAGERLVPTETGTVVPRSKEGSGLGRTGSAGRSVAHGEDRVPRPFEHLGYDVSVLVGADRDHAAAELRALWAEGPPVSVAVATGLDERLHRTSADVASLLEEATSALARMLVPSLRALPPGVPLLVLADHGFRENPSWGRGPEGRYVHGGGSLEESVVPVAVFRPAGPPTELRDGGGWG